MRRLVAALATLGGLMVSLPNYAAAQSVYPSPGSGAVPLAIMACLNSSGQAVPSVNADGTSSCAADFPVGNVTFSGTVTLSTPVGAAGWNPDIVLVGTGATLIHAARTGSPGTGRVSITVVNPDQTVSLCLGPTNSVSTSHGLCLPAIAGANATIETTTAVYGIWGDGGTHNISYSELY